MDHFHVKIAPPFFPAFNAAPQSTQPVIVLDEEGNRAFQLMRWGLVPSWSATSKLPYNTCNAKSEDVLTKTSYRSAFKTRRCLLPIDAFYEWKPLTPKLKQPYAIGMADSQPFALAGIWERWHRGAEELLSFSIMTTEANELMSRIHNRMPVIVKPSDYERWLRPSPPDQPPIDLLRPFDSEQMKAWTVSTNVNKTMNEGPDLLAAAPPIESPRTTADLFS